jgi:hypothetical protein
MGRKKTKSWTPEEIAQDQIEMQKLAAELESIQVPLTKESNMAKAKTAVTKISDKLIKVNENFTVNMYDNGFMIDIGGRDAENEWKTAKIMVSSVEELLTLIQEAAEMDREA